MKGFGTSLVPDLFAPRERPVDDSVPQFLFQPLGLQCPRCGRALAVEENVLFGGIGSRRTTFSVGCFVPLDVKYGRGARMGGEHHWDIPEAEARQLAVLAVGCVAARRELVKRVAKITKGKTFGEQLAARKDIPRW